MIGALVGFNGIKSYMTEAVVNYDCVNNPKPNGEGIPRPDFLSTKKYALKNINKLIELVPE